MLLVLLAGLALVGAGLLGLAWSLDTPWAKRRVQAIVRKNTGFEIDYAATHLRLLSGLRIDEVVVRGSSAPGAVYLAGVRIAALEARWTVRSLLRPGPRLTAVALRGVELNFLRDGRPAPPEPAGAASGAAPPLSRRLAEIFAGAPIVQELLVEQAALTLEQPGLDGPGEVWRLSGLTLAADCERDRPGWRLRLAAGTESAPLALLLTRDRGGARRGEAELQLRLDATAAASGVALVLDVRAPRQSLVPEVKATRLVHLEGQFTPRAGKSEASLTRAELADGAATLTASLELADGAGVPPLLHKARGVIDLTGLLRVVPADLLPVSAQAARLEFDIDQLVLAPVPRLAASGHVVADASFDALRAALAAGGLELERGRLLCRAEPTAGGGMALQLSAPLQALSVTTGGQELSGANLDLSGEASLDAAGTWRGAATLRFASLERTAAEKLAARTGELTVQTDALQLDPEAPLAARGLLELRGSLGTLALRRKNLQVEAAGIGVSARSRLLGHAPYALELSLPIARLRLLGPRSRLFFSQPARLGVELSALQPNLAQLRRSQGGAKVSLELGAARARLVAQKRADQVAFTVSGQTASLGLVRPFIARGAEAGIPWERIGLTLDTRGSIDRLGSATPLLHHRTELTLSRPGYGAGGGRIPIAAQELKLTATSDGTLRRHDGTAELRLRGLTVGERQVGDGSLTLGLSTDTEAKTAQVRLSAATKNGPDATLAAKLGVDPEQRALTYDLDGSLTRLGPLHSLLASVSALKGLELGPLSLGLGGRGAVTGLVEPSGPRGRLRLVQNPLKSLGVNGSLELRAQTLRWVDGDRAVATPHLVWKATLAADATRRKLHADLQLGELHVALGRHQLDFTKVQDALDLTVTGDLAQGEGELAHVLTVGGLRQSLAPGYAIGELTVTLQGKRSRDGVVRISALRLHNVAGGTTVNLRGGLDLGDTRRSLSLRGTLEQRLASLWSVRKDYVGEGTMSLSLRIESGNLSLYKAGAALRMTDGNIRLPSRGIALDSIDGEIPVAADLILDRRGVHLLRDASRNAYSELHFADQHSLLSRRSFISVARLATPLFTVAPLVGNLQIDNNIVSLSQLEMGMRGGRLTGQSVLDFGEKDAAIKLHLRASNIEARRGERFDGNAAVVISARDRSIDGRAEILRIGRGHLLDLLDLHDPHHEDFAVNRVRRALSLGYPDRVRLSFDHGFAAARITFAGLASLVRVDELRGIPTGPIIDKLLIRPLSLEENGP